MASFSIALFLLLLIAGAVIYYYRGELHEERTKRKKADIARARMAEELYASHLSERGHVNRLNELLKERKKLRD